MCTNSARERVDELVDNILFVLFSILAAILVVPAFVVVCIITLALCIIMVPVGLAMWPVMLVLERRDSRKLSKALEKMEKEEV